MLPSRFSRLAGLPGFTLAFRSKIRKIHCCSVFWHPKICRIWLGISLAHMDTPIKQTKLNHESPFSWGGAAAAPPPKDVVPLFSRPSRPRVAQRCLETTKSRVFHEDVGWRSGRVDWFLWGRLGVVVVQLRVNNPVQVQEKRSEILNLDSGSFWITVCYCQSTCDVILHDSWFNQCFLMNKTYIKKIQWSLPSSIVFSFVNPLKVSANPTCIISMRCCVHGTCHRFGLPGVHPWPP